MGEKLEKIKELAKLDRLTSDRIFTVPLTQKLDILGIRKYYMVNNIKLLDLTE